MSLTTKTTTASSVKNSASFIADHAKHVSIDRNKVAEFAKSFLANSVHYSTKAWKQHPLNPKVMDERAIDWIFLVDLLNFSFWPERHPLKEFAVDGHRGYWSLCAAINRALYVDKIPVTSAAWMRYCSMDDVCGVFRPDQGCRPVPMLESRLECIRKAGEILETRLDGSFITLIKRSNKSSAILLNLIIETFGDLFDDASVYHEALVVFHKRAQILIADIWACFEGQGFGEFHDISETITMFADYRVPQALVYFGVIVYSPELLSVLRKQEDHHLSLESDVAMNDQNMMKRGDEFEIEIRGLSIHAVELIIHEIKALKPDLMACDVNAILIDFYLWDLAKAKKEEMRNIPIHRVRSIYY
jgi:hypothetical protein